ncbi:hypothetical protein HXY33_02040 [Candidatus Bathyarchaeota archaeon]|nr:hypothetical protein [Candidatus Bathyarchaeota archaeon]
MLRLDISVQTWASQEYQQYVNNYLNSGVLGNWTYLEKPLFPIAFNESQIFIGQNWSVVTPLLANHSYHIYCYGEWINNSSEPQTDYDIYVYDPLGEMVGYHTESAGLPEHLGTSTEEPFFVPKTSGNYTFTIKNDPRESNGSKPATFMIIENVECNVWHQHYVEGKDNSSLPVFTTSWAYEFFTDSKHVEVWVTVPDTLDMYEARVYLMANPKSGKGVTLNGVPLAWEPGLYSEISTPYGGYNLESEEYRGLAYASCEFHGQDMLLNFTSSSSGPTLYHLVFIGENGFGTIEYLVKTEFANTRLEPLTVPGRVYPYNETVIAYTSNATDLVDATLQYSTDGWRNITALTMELVDNRTCRAVIPGQQAGTSVSYRVAANDVIKNVLYASGVYPVKYPSRLNISLSRNTIIIGENITVRGNLSLASESLRITVTFASQNITKSITSLTLENGSFTASYKPEILGTWEVQAFFAEDEFAYESASTTLTAKVDEPSIFAKYSLYIGGGVGATIVAGIIVYLKKSRQ